MSARGRTAVDHKDCIRGYHRSSKAWYARTGMDNEVLFGMYHKDGGTTGEMRIVWKELSGRLCPQLQAFDDSWSALSLFTDLIEKMGTIDNELIQEEDFCKLLDSCGFTDLTSYSNSEEKEEMVTIELPKKKAAQLGLI